MIPANFRETNALFGPPDGMEESQVQKIPAYVGETKQGSLDGSQVVVVCWQMSDRERQLITEGGPVYISFLGGMPPHYPSTSFEEASHPS